MLHGGANVRRLGYWHFMAATAAVAAVLLSATMPHAALQPTPDVSGRISLTGQLLIATPVLKDSPFERTVILMAQHTRDGALGVVVNRPLDERKLASLLAAVGADSTDVGDVSVRIFLGGPVSPTLGVVVHSAEYHLANTVDIDGKVALTVDPDVLRDIGQGKGPNKSLIAFGYAGWGPSQLDDEIASGAWYTVTEDPALVFDEDRSKVWDAAMARHRTEH
jgi:putative transcriptional regulator